MENRGHKNIGFFHQKLYFLKADTLTNLTHQTIRKSVHYWRRYGHFWPTPNFGFFFWIFWILDFFSKCLSFNQVKIYTAWGPKFQYKSSKTNTFLVTGKTTNWCSNMESAVNECVGKALVMHSEQRRSDHVTCDHPRSISISISRKWVDVEAESSLTRLKNQFKWVITITLQMITKRPTANNVSCY